jgi:murein DD-endopeptidase MepM/ murein hydrolase activator NlpD
VGLGGALSCTALLLVASASDGLGDELSVGVYRIPYDERTTVAITNDHTTHKPPGRLDMVGRDGKRIVAAADGIVRFVVDHFGERQRANDRPCRNNYVWLEHSNGEWTKYSHLQKGSVRERAQLSVGQQVPAGTYLGDEGDVGCATGSHLHFEVAVPRNPGDPINAAGYIRGWNRTPRICKVPGDVLVKGHRYLAGPCPR